MTTIATSLERCTLITMHERAPHTVPQADRLAGSHARSRRRAVRLRPHLADTGLVVIQLGVGVDLVETRVFEGPL